MIAHLTGSILKKTTASVIINVGGIGYEVSVPLSTFYQLPEASETTSLYIHTHVREDSLSLFGFFTTLEKNIFMMLISVSGIGPRLAVNILSGIGPQELLDAIVKEDSARLQAIPGVGKKMAQRIVLELKDRASRPLDQEKPSPPNLPAGNDQQIIMDDALSALINLGYSAKAANSALQQARARGKDNTLEDLVREGLKILA